MSSMTFNQKTFQPVPPEKGSFPLDREGACREFMIKYLRCLYDNNNSGSECRNISKSYLACRMDNNLMVRADWSDLGFDDDQKNTEKKE